MRLIVHMGLHKTGSTYLQHLFNDNHSALEERGVYHQWQDGYPAHHDCAWALANGRGDLLSAMIAEAREAKCPTLLFSSEELEAALYDPLAARTIEDVAARQGVAEIEWHIVIREPGASFASLCGYMHHHDYADSLDLFYRAMSRGGIYFPARRGAPKPFAFNCFDYAHHIGEFAKATQHPVFVQDFDDRDPYPGWRLPDHLGVRDTLVNLPADVARNARKSEQEIAIGYVERMLAAVPNGDDRMRLLPAMEAGLRANLEGVPTYAEIISRRFGPGFRQVLKAHGIDQARQAAA